MRTSDIFEKEINYISNDTLKDIVRATLNEAPECIQVIPASSSGKYHSKNDRVIGCYDEGGLIRTGGLVNHIKAVTAIAYSLMDSNAFKDIALGRNFEKYIDNADEILQRYQDAALAACILHDCCKPDDTPQHNTRFDHPLLAADLFMKMASMWISEENEDYMSAVVPLVFRCIKSHMNRWNTSKHMPDVILPLPEYGIEVFVSLCDHIASRNFINFDMAVYEGRA